MLPRPTAEPAAAMGLRNPERGEPELTSGRQEELESILNDYLYCTEL